MFCTSVYKVLFQLPLRPLISVQRGGKTIREATTTKIAPILTAIALSLCALPSDSKPSGITPITISNDSARERIPTYYQCPMINRLGEIYGESNDRNYAVVYVWDAATRSSIYGVVSEMINQIYTLDWNDNSSQSVSVGLSGARLAITVASIGVALVSTSLVGGAAGIAIDLLNLAGIELGAASLALSIGSLVASFVLGPSVNTNKINLINYLINLKAAFEIGVGSNDNEIIMIKSILRTLTTLTGPRFAARPLPTDTTNHR